MADYKKEAEDFLKKANATITITKSKNQSAPLWVKKDEKHGYKYDITIERNGRQYAFNFWNSIHDREQEENALNLIQGAINPLEAKKYALKLIDDYKKGEFEPSAYDILASLTKNDPGTFADFCSEFGYNEDSRTAEKTFLAVIDEYKNVERLFFDVMEELQEIS